MSTGPHVQAAFAATLVDEWVRAGLCDAVVSPGSRSTPVLAALAADGRPRVHLVLDERSAGFVALGLGLATAAPAAVVTTSGTASVEVHPAIVEAHQAGVPLLVVTADRPPELHGVGAPQTIDQDGLYGSVSRWTASPGVPDDAATASWRSLGSRAVSATTSEPGGPGPVHLNLAFREPLLGDASRVSVPPGRFGGRPWHRVSRAQPAGAERSVVELLVSHAGGRGIVVAGADAGDPDIVVTAACRLGWPILADPRSGARQNRPGVVASSDALLRSAPVRDWVPEFVLRLGRPPASKVLAQWLAALPPTVPQVLVDPTGSWSDPERRVDLVTKASPTALMTEVISDLSATDHPATELPATDHPATELPATEPRSWMETWCRAEAEAQRAIDEVLSRESDGLGEPGLARRLHASLPDDSVLVVSSSMPVRDIEWYATARRGLRVVSNRGANGIDGVVSTAIGVALGGRPTVALIGDLAFAYDLSALLWSPQRDIDCTFVVVDNDGGGIFSFLPQSSELPTERFERLWGTPHGLDLLAVAGAYGASCSEITSPEDLATVVAAVGSGRGVRVSRYRSNREANVVLHDRCNAAVAEAVADLRL